MLFKSWTLLATTALCFVGVVIGFVISGFVVMLLTLGVMFETPSSVPWQLKIVFLGVMIFSTVIGAIAFLKWILANKGKSS